MPTAPLRHRALPFLICALVMVSAVLSVADEATGGEEKPPDTPLQTRAKALLEVFPEAKTKEARVEMREQLLAMADTLEAAGDDALASQCLERAGMISYYLAEYDSATDIWARGLEVARRSDDKSRIAALLNAQAVGVSITGDNEGAVTLQLELVELRREMGDVRGEGVSWHNLAYSYFALFRYPEAIDAISNALRLHRKAGNNYAVGVSMSVLSNALFEVGRREEALAMADSAVARTRNIGNPSALGAALQARGRQLHYAGRYEEAVSDFEEAHDVLTAAGVANVAAVSDINWANVLVSLGTCDRARRVIDAANATLAPIGSPEAIVWGQCVSARISARCGDPEQGREALLATIDHLEAVRDSIPDAISRADAFRMAGGAYTDLALLEVEQGDPETAWVAIESGSSRLFGEALGIEARSTLAGLQLQLGELNAAVLQLGYGTVDRNVMFVITPDDVRARTIAIPPRFHMDVEQAMRLLSSGASDGECRPVLERISGAVLGSDGAALDGMDTIERLVVIPGDLAGFPVETLPLSGGRTLGDEFPVAYAPSATAFLHLQTLTADKGSVLVFADPEIHPETDDGAEVAMRDARMSLAPLPEARAEGKAVGGTLLVGPRATRSQFLERAGQVAVVHVAAHALVDAMHPAYSGIVLAGDGGDLLTVGDIRDLPLEADLVSLSGCETAGGYMTTGDGAFGLTRAFLVAGARTVVSSWWAVEDEGARRFMELYYGALRRGAARDVALHDARAKMAAEGYPLRDRMAFALTGATAEPVPSLASAGSGAGWGLAGSIAVVFIVVAVATAWRRRRAA